MSTTPTPEAPSPELIRMHNAGQLLANCAFNLAQHAGEPVSESVAATLKQCQSEWDAACLAFKAARAALTQGAGEAVEPVGWRYVSKEGFTQIFKDEPPPKFKTQCDPLFTAQQLQQAVARALEELKFHPQASHVEPNYRDWFNKTIDAALRERNP